MRICLLICLWHIHFATRGTCMCDYCDYIIYIYICICIHTSNTEPENTKSTPIRQWEVLADKSGLLHGFPHVGLFPLPNHPRLWPCKATKILLPWDHLSIARVRPTFRSAFDWDISREATRLPSGLKPQLSAPLENATSDIEL